MAVTPRLGLRQQQRLALTPQLRQSIALLALPAAELTEQVAAEAAENPFLIYRPMRTAMGGAAYEFALGTVAARPPLTERLATQIGMLALTQPIKRAALIITAHVGPDGYLDGRLEDIAGDHGIAPGVAEAALVAVKSCDPTGAGSRTFTEFLAALLIEDGIDPGIAPKLAESVEGLADTRRAPRLTRELGLDDPSMRRVRALLRRMPASPAWGEDATAVPRLPDLRVERQEDGRLTIQPGRSFGLALDSRLAARVAGNAAAAEKLVRAKELLSALERRRATLVSIGEAILRRQDAFFLDGDSRLRPLTRAELAGELGLHPSTLGRAISGKALEFRGRLIPFARFFSTSLPSATEGAIAASALRDEIVRLIAAEQAESPLSDAVLCDLLRSRGVDISRRTVAKYRESMRIPSSAQRRRRARIKAGEVADGGRVNDHRNDGRRTSPGASSGA